MELKAKGFKVSSVAMAALAWSCFVRLACWAQAPSCIALAGIAAAGRMISLPSLWVSGLDSKVCAVLYGDINTTTITCVILLQARYLNEYLVKGEAPTDPRGVFKQRSRWCKGQIQVRVKQQQKAATGVSTCPLGGCSHSDCTPCLEQPFCLLLFCPHAHTVLPNALLPCRSCLTSSTRPCLTPA